jgi:hypothetical protein
MYHGTNINLLQPEIDIRGECSVNKLLYVHDFKDGQMRRVWLVY